MIGLLVHFYQQVLAGSSYSTASYVEQLQNFRMHFLPAVSLQVPYQDIFILQSAPAVCFIVCFHEWLQQQRLHLDYDVIDVSQDRQYASTE